MDKYLYNIHINQAAAVENGFDLDLTDLAIFDFIKTYANSGKCDKVQTETGIYFWIAHTQIISNMPLLHIKTKQGIIKRVDKLVSAGVLEKYENCEKFGKTLYRFGDNYDKLVFYTPVDTPQREFRDTHNESLGEGVNESLGNNKYKEDNKNNNHNKIKGTSEPRQCLFSNSRFSNYGDFFNCFSSQEYKDIDIAYYYNVISDWSASKGIKKLDWIATTRNWMRRDKDEGKLHKIQPKEKTVQYMGYEFTQDEVDTIEFELIGKDEDEAREFLKKFIAKHAR